MSLINLPIYIYMLYCISDCSCYQSIYQDLACTFRARYCSTFVVGTSSDLGQPFRPRQKSWVWVGRIGFLVTTFAQKEH